MNSIKGAVELYLEELPEIKEERSNWRYESNFQGFLGMM